MTFSALHIAENHDGFRADFFRPTLSGGNQVTAGTLPAMGFSHDQARDLDAKARGEGIKRVSGQPAAENMRRVVGDQHILIVLPSIFTKRACITSGSVG